jgi:hypothetical protein
MKLSERIQGILDDAYCDDVWSVEYNSNNSEYRFTLHGNDDHWRAADASILKGTLRDHGQIGLEIAVNALLDVDVVDGDSELELMELRADNERLRASRDSFKGAVVGLTSEPPPLKTTARSFWSGR